MIHVIIIALSLSEDITMALVHKLFFLDVVGDSVHISNGCEWDSSFIKPVDKKAIPFTIIGYVVYYTDVNIFFCLATKFSKYSSH